MNFCKILLIGIIHVKQRNSASTRGGEKNTYAIITEAYGIIKNLNNNPGKLSFYSFFPFYKCWCHTIILRNIRVYGDRSLVANDENAAQRVLRAATALAGETPDYSAANKILYQLRIDKTFFPDGDLYREIRYRYIVSFSWLCIFVIIWMIMKLVPLKLFILGLSIQSFLVYGIAGIIGYIVSWMGSYEYKTGNNSERIPYDIEIFASPIFSFLCGCLTFIVINSKIINITPNGVNEKLFLFLLSFLSGFKGPQRYHIIDKIGNTINENK